MRSEQNGTCGRGALLTCLGLAAALALCLAGPAWGAGKGSGSTGSGGSPGNSGGSGGSGGGSTSAETDQTISFNDLHAVDIQNNGAPAHLNGADHLIALNPVVRPDDQSRAKPALGLSNVSGGWVNGGSDSASSGMTISGQHNDLNITTANLDVSGAQLVPRSRNDLTLKDASLERLIQTAKNAADYTIDLSTNNQTATSTTGGTNVSLQGNSNFIGDANNFKVVYATGRTTATGVQENPLHISGQGIGYGLLVVEVDDPANAQVIFSGQYTWVGLIVVVANKRITGNNNPLLQNTGGGQGSHVLGGAVLYYRNHRKSASQPGTIYGNDVYTQNGQSDFLWSYDAVMRALNALPNALRVRSWRKLDI